MMEYNKKNNIKLSSFMIIILGFIGLILLGAVILMLPISSRARVFTSFDKALFTSTSAACVTGLIVEDTATYWSRFGQSIILILIQIGGLGVVTVTSFLAVLAGKKISLKQRQTMQNSISAPQVGGIVKFTKFIFIATFSIELIGALLLLPVFCSKYGAEGIWMSLFHSVSAFCNAGFDLMGGKSGKFSSLTSLSDNPYFTLIICALIIIGGIGFLTWNDIVTKKIKFKEYRLQSKVILMTSFVLITVPAILFFFIDFKEESIVRRLCLSFFQAVTPRTAGFNTVDFLDMTDIGRTVIMFLMLIGGSPGSTAGGMKTTTIAVLFLNFTSTFSKKKSTSCFGRRIDTSIINTASALLVMYLGLSIISGIIISLVDGIAITTALFETFSAIGTVGLTLGVTSTLSIASRFILIALMFLGRVGGLTIVYAALSFKETESLKYPLENIMVG